MKNSNTSFRYRVCYTSIGQKKKINKTKLFFFFLWKDRIVLKHVPRGTVQRPISVLLKVLKRGPDGQIVENNSETLTKALIASSSQCSEGTRKLTCG